MIYPGNVLTDENTRKLIELYKKTDSRKALEVLQINHRYALITAIKDIPNNVLNFDEKLQEANLMFPDVVKSFNPKHKLKFVTYLIVKIKFGILDKIRKELRKNPPAGELHENISNDPNEYDFEKTEINKMLIEHVQKLPYNEKVIVGCILSGMNQVDIAKQSGVSPARINVLYQAALKKLKKMIGGSIDEV